MAEEFDKDSFQKNLESMNLAEEMDGKELQDIGIAVCQWLDDDEEARRPWIEKHNRWLELATQVMTRKSYPWPDASNVKYPLLATAAQQFGARAYPALVPGNNLVQGVVIGRDENGEHFKSAERVGKHMSYQLLQEMDNWEEDMDRLCSMIPIVGCVFKKTYRDHLTDKNCSDLILASDLVIDYFAKSVETANRKSHLIYKTKNDIRERVNKGLWLDVELSTPGLGDSRLNPSVQATRDKIDGTTEPQTSPATPHKFVECHCWWDLDEDGYDEPYIVTVHYNSKQVVRIIPRFDLEGCQFEVDKNGKEKLVKITPIEYFTKFGFIPNPDGSIYDLGFGLLLGGINESVNTLTNQLIDSGTLNNMQAGFLGRGIRVRSGGARFLPGEWKPVDFTGDDIKKHIFPLPTKEPSSTLFALLETLVTSGKELSSIAEIMVGKMPGQNTPATTTMATIEQGLKVFTAIHKRLYRSLGQEYKKLFKLNAVYMDGPAYFTINELEGPKSQEVYATDYSPENISVKPNADPNVVSQSQKLMKVQSYGPLLELGTINPQEYTKRFLDAVEAENITALMQVEPKPDPEAQKAQAELMLKQQDAQLKMQVEQMKMQIKQQEAAMDQQAKEMELRFMMVEQQMKEKQMQVEIMSKAQGAQLDLEAKAVGHEEKLRQGAEMHEVKKQQAKDKPAAKKE